ncbi:hypothetical protein AVEN_832-1 [Araneus ventricosus]|uniref:RNA-directed DNA polymerase n=1 Tax=Araneus ventricosus TaxID=182803 RepID=A0A4Y2GDY4_ARAVE|nr:hypothetical protein AVEN_832-1 [Araneus ventricosus]
MPEYEHTKTRNTKNLREEQLKDDELRKIIECFEKDIKDEDYINWTSRGYLMNQGVLNRFSPYSESEQAQLVVPSHERKKSSGRVSTSGHYGTEGTYHRVAKRYYFTEMRKFISHYTSRTVLDAGHTKLIIKRHQTPVYSQMFATLAIELFGPLPETKVHKKWIFIIEVCSTKWVELFALPYAIAKECAVVFLEKVILRYGLHRKLLSDNGSQFVTMRHSCSITHSNSTSVLAAGHPTRTDSCLKSSGKPCRTKNRDLKPRLSILVDQHDEGDAHLPVMNTVKCDTTGKITTFLQFGRELQTTHDVTHDLRAIIDNDNFMPETSPYLK